MISPPRAGAATVAILGEDIFSPAILRSSCASIRPNFSAAAGCCSTRAHCKYSALCNPDVSRKCPCRYAPVERNNSRTDSACGVTNPYYTIEYQSNQAPQVVLHECNQTLHCIVVHAAD